MGSQQVSGAWLNYITLGQSGGVNAAEVTHCITNMRQDGGDGTIMCSTNEWFDYAKPFPGLLWFVQLFSQHGSHINN